MGLVNAGSVLQMVRNYRLVWLSGRFSGGKTSLAFEMARNYAEMGYRIITNTKSIWADDLEKTKMEDGGHVRAVVILDEGGTEFKRNSQVEEITAYSAKMDLIFLVPSFFPPANKFQVLEIQPVWNLKPIGIPYIQYKWSVKVGNFKDQGSFGWLFPQSIYGVYSRQDPGAKTDQIVDWLVERKDQFRELHGKSRGSDKLSKMEKSGMAEAELFSDSVESLKEGISEFTTLFD